MHAGKRHFRAAGLLAVVLLGGLTAQTSARERTDCYGDPLPRGALTRLGTVRYRHGGRSVAFLPDSKTVVSVGYDNGITFWGRAPAGCCAPSTPASSPCTRRPRSRLLPAVSP